MTLLCTTETGVPVPAEAVQALLLTPSSGNAVLAEEGATGTTDADGAVTLRLRLAHHGQGSYVLLFGGSRSMQIVGTSSEPLRSVVEQAVGAVRRSAPP